MPQPLEATPSPSSGDSGTDNVPGNVAADEPVARAASWLERSRFSQWLASFGLGEMPLPLLNRRRGNRR
jgi:hypothetical protein